MSLKNMTYLICFLQLAFVTKFAGSFYVADVVFDHKNHSNEMIASSKAKQYQPTGNYYLVNTHSRECRVIVDKISRDYIVRKAALQVVNVTISELHNNNHHNNNSRSSLHSSKAAKLHCHRIGTPLPSFDLPERNNDEITYRHMILFEAIQGSQDFLHLSKHLPGCFNPSIAPFNSEDEEYNHVRWIIACRVTRKGGLGLMLLDIDLNIIKQQQRSIYGLGMTELTVMQTGMFGEDFRLLDLTTHDTTGISSHNTSSLSSKLLPRYSISYVFYHNNTAQIRSAEIQLIDNKLKVVHDAYLYDRQFARQHQKNWAPFVHNHKLLFLQNIWPRMTVVSFAPPTVDLTVTENGQESLVSKLASLQQAEEADIIWDYGMIKGGTPARRINNDSYLAFFHSKQYLTPNSKVSYVFGAMTFTAERPFNITAFSRTPIVHRKFYEGAWSHWGFIDYIVFPMSFAFEKPAFDYRNCGNICLKETNLLLTIGIQDRNGYIVKVNLKQLLNSLVKVRPVSN